MDLDRQESTLDRLQRLRGIAANTTDELARLQGLPDMTEDDAFQRALSISHLTAMLDDCQGQIFGILTAPTEQIIEVSAVATAQTAQVPVTHQTDQAHQEALDDLRLLMCQRVDCLANIDQSQNDEDSMTYACLLSDLDMQIASCQQRCGLLN
jgi:hypothetical protein